MAITAEQRTQLVELYVAIAGRAPDAEGLAYWANQLTTADNGIDTTADVAAAMYASPAAKELYPDFLTAEEIVSSFYENVLGRTADAEGLAYWAGQLNANGAEQTILDMIDAVKNYSGTDADALASQQLFADKVTVGEFFAVQLGSNDLDLAASVFEDLANGATAADVTAALTNDGEVIFLTEGQDIVEGSANDDTFIARGNSSLDNADIIDGGDGVDTIEVMLDNDESAEAPMTMNVEILKVQAQERNDNDTDVGTHEDEEENNQADSQVETGAGVTNDGNPDIDAEDMVGVSQFWSVDSRDDVVIEDVRRDSTQTTIGWEGADPGGVDYGVYFSPDYIVAPGATAIGGSLTLNVADLDAILEDGGNGNYGNAVEDFPYDQLNFTFGGESYTLNIDYTDVEDHSDLAAAISAALAVEGLDGTLQAAVSGSWDTVHPDTADQFLNIPSIVISKVDNASEGSFDADASSWDTTGNVPGDTAYITRVLDEETTTLPALTQTDIILDYVGRGSKAGDLQVGNMSTGSSGSAGIQQFNIDVDRNSWIETLSSTNNALEVVNVENIGANGTLRIEDLTDVRVFDADTSEGKLSSDMTGMLNDVTLIARLTQEVSEKYLARQDDDADASDDNSDVAYNYVVDKEFSYDFGDGNDSLSLAIDSSNLQDAGTATHEDFILEVNGGAGDDSLWVTTNTETVGDWYENQKTNNDALKADANDTMQGNLRINGGEGEDTILTTFSGDYTIDGGDDSDTIYLDQTGEDRHSTGVNLDGEGDNNNAHAIWVLNASDVAINDLDSNEPNNTVSTVNMALTVTFKGFEVTVDLAETVGALSNVDIDDLRINQAIKEAINNDAVLNKLLSAEDGPGRTLTIQSRIDGEMAADDLTVDLHASSTALTTAQTNAGLTAYTDADGTLDDIYDGNVAFATNGGLLEGEDSDATQDSDVNGGTADGAADVIVLGTGEDSNDTVVYEGLNNGTDTVVNFEDSAVIGTVTTFPNASVATPEIITVAFQDLTLVDADAATTVTFDGDVIALANGTPDTVIPAIDVAAAFVAAYTETTYSITDYDPATGVVELTANATGDIDPDTAAGDFVFNANAAGSTVTVTKVQDGADGYVPATQASFDVDFTGTIIDADAAANISFDGTDVAVVEGDGALTVAAKVAASTFATWTVVDNLDGTVTFTSIAAGDRTADMPADADFGDTVNGILADATTTAATGADAIGTSGAAVVTTDYNNMDYIDFSDYDAVAVYVDGALVTGTAPTTEDQVYISLTESTTNDGEYLIELFSEEDSDGPDFDTAEKDGTIGTVDFGEEQAFDSTAFIL